MRIILELYFAINMFLAGYYLADKYTFNNGITEKLSCILWCIGTMLFGGIYVSITFICVFIMMSLKTLDDIFQIRFFISYFLTKKYDNLKRHQLDTVNRITLNVRTKNTIKDRIYRYCTTLINKRNNYTYEKYT